MKGAPCIGTGCKGSLDKLAKKGFHRAAVQDHGIADLILVQEKFNQGAFKVKE